MLNWALAFFICAVVAAFFGFTDIAFNLRLVGDSVADVAKVFFIMFVILFLVSLVAGLLRRD